MMALHVSDNGPRLPALEVCAQLSFLVGLINGASSTAACMRWCVPLTESFKAREAAAQAKQEISQRAHIGLAVLLTVHYNNATCLSAWCLLLPQSHQIVLAGIQPEW